jgi:serine/threonine protein kinase
VKGVLKDGQRLGPFSLERKIAVGGMAEIWSASQGDRRYAIKVLLEPLSQDPTLRTMFMDEVRIAQRLRHPNIIEVEGQYEDQGLMFQAMELVEGKDLRRLLAAAVKAKSDLPPHLAALITREVARGLGYAHAARGDHGEPLEIVHRDVSPHNVMIDRTGRVMILDFGVARARERMTRTAVGIIKGKLTYMSPEQMLAQPVTALSDVFSLGIVLWEMLAMRRLFGGKSDAAIFAQVCEGQVPPIRSERPEVPETLAELVHAMLSVQPKKRPESMRAVENQLSRILFTSFAEEEASQDALARWALPLMKEERKKTAPIAIPKKDDRTALDRGPPIEALPSTVAIPIAEPESGAARTEALDIGESFADLFRDDPAHATTVEEQPTDPVYDLEDALAPTYPSRSPPTAPTPTDLSPPSPPEESAPTPVVTPHEMPTPLSPPAGSDSQDVRSAGEAGGRKPAVSLPPVREPRSSHFGFIVGALAVGILVVVLMGRACTG